MFAEVVNLLALLALEATLVYPLRADVAPQALPQIDIASNLHTLPRDRDTEVHKIIECETLVATALALHLVD